MDMKNIRNFSIIAHIDHGKSTLADRILEKAGAVSKREAKDQLLDSMDLERERGITIKLNAASFTYKKDNTKYLLNLIDTPGHVDFSYEVSRSLAACEGAILIVDATQGIEAQTIANLYLALDNNLTIIPVINKIDLPSANVDEVKKEIKDTFGFDEDEIILTSAKTGAGIDELLNAIIEKIPAPKGSVNDKLQALIFDSVYDSYRGAVIWIRVVNGSVKIGDKIKMIGEDSSYEVTELGIHTPKEKKKDELKAGEVGYLCASIKSVSDVKVGDTITLLKNPGKALPGYKHIKPMVYCGLYPTESNRYNDLKDALEKLKLNDASLSFEPDTSAALGFGFRCGFLGMLHMDVTEERIEREFKIDIIATSPSVVYEVVKTNNEVLYIDNPSDMPDNSKIKEIKEPIIKASIFVPSEYIGSVMELCKEKRGQYINLEYINEKRVNLLYYLPLSEVVYDFFDKLKSFTKGYASFDYELDSYKTSNLVKMDILINGALVDALSSIVHKEFAYTRGKKVVENLKKLIPRQLFEVPIQAVIGTKVIARSDIKAMKKNVLAKCYGGDITRKRKLLEKQKEGKKRMKKVGNVDIPQEAFLSVLKVNDD
ncbi:MAG TPA: elongation factor 4 [Candidatus Aphodocola excrementigallinarum]|uniref:Elongation factor 4 n=1 Tax=Candidatus Aphodocola excrementigallinarum TaxID=2840670 RepID=A0A9D1LHM8_9FIRM|nr:elongation factor 4 [Candidatus Aphodocola excrementigallinarum]